MGAGQVNQEYFRTELLIKARPEIEILGIRELTVTSEITAFYPYLHPAQLMRRPAKSYALNFISMFCCIQKSHALSRSGSAAPYDGCGALGLTI